MDGIFVILLPFVLLLARVGAFMGVAPIFGSSAVPGAVKSALVVWVALFFAFMMPPAVNAGMVHWMRAVMLVVQEVIIGLALGLAARFIFMAVQQGGSLIAQAMGMADAGVIDPVSGEESETIATFMEMTITLAFLAIGGHHVLLILLARSYQVFPMASLPDVTALAQGLVSAGSAMLVMGLKLSAPLVAAFMVLSVVLGIIARALPEMNILFESFPLRIGLGLLLTAAIMPGIGKFTVELGNWMSRIIASGS